MKTGHFGDAPKHVLYELFMQNKRQACNIHSYNTSLSSANYCYCLQVPITVTVFSVRNRKGFLLDEEITGSESITLPKEEQFTKFDNSDLLLSHYSTTELLQYCKQSDTTPRGPQIKVLCHALLKDLTNVDEQVKESMKQIDYSDLLTVTL